MHKPATFVLYLTASTFALEGWALALDTSRVPEGNLILINANTYERQTIVEGPVQSACFSNDGQRIAYALNNNLYVINSTLSGNSIKHTVNWNGHNLMFVRNNSKEYLYWDSHYQGLCRVELGTSLVEKVISSASDILGQVSHDGTRACIRFNSGGWVYSANLIYKIWSGIATGCMPALSVDGEWCAHNTTNHDTIKIYKWWDHTAQHCITGWHISDMRFSRASADYIVYTQGTDQVAVCHRPTNTTFILGDGYAMDFFEGKFDSSVQTVEKPLISPSGGIIFEETIPVTIRCETPGAKLRYTINGTTPDLSTSNSIQTGDTLFLSIPENSQTCIHARAFKDSLFPSTVATANFIRSTLKEPDNPDSVIHGLKFQYYEMPEPVLESLAVSLPTDTGTVSGFSLDILQRENNVGIVYSGYFYALTDGIYTFLTESFGISELYIGSKMIVSNYPGLGKQHGTIGLKKGMHQIFLLYQNSDLYKPHLSLYYEGPGIPLQPISGNELYRDKPDYPLITILDPNGGEIYQTGEEIAINWSTDCDIISSVILMISPDAGKNNFYIDLSGSLRCDTTNYGSFSWTIPDSIDGTPLSSDSCIIIVSKYDDFKLSDASDNPFVIKPGEQGLKISGNSPFKSTPEIRINNFNIYMAAIPREITHARLFAANGRMLMTKQVTSCGILPVSNVAEGIYWLQLLCKDKVFFSKKVIVGIF
ncbi:MAG: hypothetical protein GF401_15505 [Chitinivibrionales bacterium]|nr:hypothetical protein [Chitinivibrionales bacterium]